MIDTIGKYTVIGPGAIPQEGVIPQALGPDASPAFTGLFLTGLDGNCIVMTGPGPGPEIITDPGFNYVGGVLTLDGGVDVLGGGVLSLGNGLDVLGNSELTLGAMSLAGGVLTLLNGEYFGGGSLQVGADTLGNGMLVTGRAVAGNYGRSYWEGQGFQDSIYSGKQGLSTVSARLAVMDSDAAPALYGFTEEYIGIGAVNGYIRNYTKVKDPSGRISYCGHLVQYENSGATANVYFWIENALGFSYHLGPGYDGAQLLGGYNYNVWGGGGFIAGQHGVEDVYEVLQSDPGFGSLNSVAAFPYDNTPGNMCPAFRTENDTLIVLDQSLRTSDNVEFALLAYDAIGGQLYIDGNGLVTADSAAITSGTLIAGTVADTRQINAIYLQVQEVAATPGFLVDITFEGIIGAPKVLHFKGRYQGNAGHDVKLQVWNYDAGTWDNLTAAAQDIPHTTEDAVYTFSMPGSLGGTWPAHYVNAGQMKVRFNHTSAGNATHNLYIDYLAIQQSSLDMAVEGTSYTLVNGMQAASADNFTLTPGTGEGEVLIAGKYRVTGTASIAGTPGATIEGHAFIDAAAQGNIGFMQTLPASGAEFRTVSFAGYLDLAVGEVITFRMKADRADAWISINDYSMVIEYVGK